MSHANTTRIEEMHALYIKGFSLSQVGAVYNVTRQSVYCVFKYHGKYVRPKKAPLPFASFNKTKYTLRNNGYYGRTNGKRTLMHRDVWEYYKGPIPPGYDIHHINNIRTDNRIENLECLPKSEHTRKYSPHNNQYTRGRKRA